MRVAREALERNLAQLEATVEGLRSAVGTKLAKVQEVARSELASRGLPSQLPPMHLQLPWTKPVRSRRVSVSPLRSYNFAAILPGDSAAELVITSSIYNFLNIYNSLLIGRLILTWFPEPPAVIVNPLSTICDPYLNLFRGVIPPLGGLDFSPILAFFALNVFTNAASALPAELPKDILSAPMAVHRSNEKLTWQQQQSVKRFGPLVHAPPIRDSPCPPASEAGFFT